MDSLPVSIIIPTYQRDQVLLDTIHQLLGLAGRASQIIIVDQTPQHGPEVEAELSGMHEQGEIVWVRLASPSIPAAMNAGLLAATHDIVLFLDDDIEITSNLIREHWAEYQEPGISAVVGRVVQSWEESIETSEVSLTGQGISDPDAFRFNSGHRREVARVMAGNLSVRKDVAIGVGGFDENFVKVAYRFEAEFSDRLIGAGHTIIFQPEASLKHLKVSKGGTRSYGEHLTTISPSHAVGRYYYYLVARHVSYRWYKFLFGPLLAVRTKFHLSHPWWIPGSLIAEVGGILWALLLYAQGRKLIDVDSTAYET